MRYFIGLVGWFLFGGGFTFGLQILVQLNDGTGDKSVYNAMLLIAAWVAAGSGLLTLAIVEHSKASDHNVEEYDARS